MAEFDPTLVTSFACPEGHTGGRFQLIAEDGRANEYCIECVFPDLKSDDSPEGGDNG